MVEWMQTYMVSALLAFSFVKTTGAENVCPWEPFSATCASDEVIVIDRAEYGRMEVGRCGVSVEGGHVGCTNDVLPLIDAKCSGKRECHFTVGTPEFDGLNAACMKELRAYLRVSYSCVKVAYKQRGYCSNSRVSLQPHDGFIASHVTDETGCGSARSPWGIDAKPGQTISVSILDFGASSGEESHQYLSCRDIYGYIVEKSLGVNETFCKGRDRRRTLYSSKSNTVEINIVPSNRRRNNQFILSYQIVGCSDLTPPAHAWYKRDAETAQIGCDENDDSWKLTCHGNTWNGAVGNCTAKPIAAATSSLDIPLKDLLIVAAMIGGTIVLAVLVIVAGVVHIKKFRHSQEMRLNAIQGTLLYQPRPRQMDPRANGPRVQYHAMTCMRGHDPSCTLGASRAQTLTARGPAPPSIGKSQRQPPTTGTGRRLDHIWEVPIPPPDDEQAGPSEHPEGIYMNPSESSCDTNSSQPTGSAASTSRAGARPPPPTTAPPDDDMSSYYSMKTGHKYYVLEKQNENNQ